MTIFNGRFYIIKYFISIGFAFRRRFSFYIGLWLGVGAGICRLRGVLLDSITV